MYINEECITRIIIYIYTHYMLPVMGRLGFCKSIVKYQIYAMASKTWNLQTTLTLILKNCIVWWGPMWRPLWTLWRIDLKCPWLHVRGHLEPWTSNLSTLVECFTISLGRQSVSKPFNIWHYIVSNLPTPGFELVVLSDALNWHWTTALCLLKRDTYVIVGSSCQAAANARSTA